MKPKFLRINRSASLGDNRAGSCSLPQQCMLAMGFGLAVAAITTSTAHADATWVGDTSQNWSTAANWSSDPANPSGNFFINTAVANVYPIISGTPGFTPVDIFIGSASGSTGRVDQNAGTASTGNGNWFFVGSNGGTGSYNLADTAAAGGTFTSFGMGAGSFTAGRFAIGGRENSTGTGTVNVNTSGSLTLNNGNGTPLIIAGSGGTGTFNLDNGTVAVTGGELWVGSLGTGTFNQSNGTVSSNGYFVIGRGNNLGGIANGTYNLTGGTVNAATAFGVTAIGSSRSSAGTLNVSGGGTFNSNAGMFVGEGWQGTGVATGQLNVSGGGLVNLGTSATGLALGVQTGAEGTVNLDGGTIQTAIVTRGAGTGTFNFNGGTLKAAASSNTFMNGLTAAEVKANGAIVDSNSFNITIGQSLNGAGGMTKTGAGTLTLAGSNSFAGASSVGVGTLEFSTQASSIGGLTVDNAATLRVKAFDTASTPLTTTSLTAAAGSSLSFDFNSLAVGTATPRISTAALSASGTVSVNILNAGNLASGAHKLIAYSSFSGGGTFTGSPFTLGPRSTGTLTNAANALTLTVNGDAPKWTGLDNGNWIVGTTGAAKNWKLIGTNVATDYIQGDSVRFDDSVTTGTTAVNISAADISPASTLFSNSSKNYTLGSSGGFGITGAGLFTKGGTGALVITNANSYTGLTTIETGATLTLGNGTSGNDGNIAGTSEVSNSGTLAYNRFGENTAAYPINGTGAVVKSGAGTQILTATNGYTGGTTVNAGTLQITTTAGAANNGTFQLNGGIFQINLGAGTNFGYGATINLTAPSTLGNAAVGSNANLQGQINYTGALDGGSNALNVANTGLARLYMNGTLSNLSQINVLSGAMGFDINSGNDRGLAPVDVANGASLWFAGNDANPIFNSMAFHGGDGIGAKGALHYEGGIAVPAPLLGDIALVEGTTGFGAAFAADTITLLGTVSGNGALNVVSGGVTLGTDNSYTGGSIITLGRLLAATNAALGTGAVSTSTAAGVQLQLGEGVSLSNALTINGSSFTGQGVLYVPTGTATHSGPISITAAATVGGHFAAGTGTLNLTGAITSTVPITVRNGTVVLANTGSSYSALNVQQGTVQLGANNVIPTANSVDLGASGAATLDLGGFNQTLAGLTKNTNAATVTNSGSSDSTLTTNGTFAFGGSIQNGATHKTALTVASGVLTLGGANTFTGNINVSGGLTLADNAQLRFTPGPDTLVNSIDGAGAANLDGDFVIDLAGASVANGNSWLLVDVTNLTEAFSGTFSVVDFTESANVWTKVDGENTWTFREDNGVLSLAVGAVSAYATWATGQGLTGANNAATLDPEFDGIANALEFVLGGNPLASDTPKLPVLTTDATNFIFTFNRADESETEVALTFQYGSALSGWTDVAIGAASAGQVAVTENAAAADSIVVTIPKTSAVGGKLFGRLRAVK
ncbi:MAG: autotransporter-associated beta strand repeat-containing protein [Verrucomicrobiota bacterium]